MNKELIDHVWKHCLPKEFKEGVKNYYEHTDSCSREEYVLESIFGEHNLLTSDAEGEEDEMLCVSRKDMQFYYQYYKAKRESELSAEQKAYYKGRTKVLLDLFGSKCLPDENYSNVEKLEKNGEVEPKPAEPKFAKGDMIHCKFFGYEGDYRVIGYTDGSPKYYACIDKDGFNYRFPESYLEPYTEPKEEVAKMKPIESKVRVYLATKEEDEEFRQLLYKNGFKWNTGESLIDYSVWSFDKEESKIHNIYPNKIVTYSGDITPNILPFSNFKKQYFEENVNLSQETANCDKQFNNILKDSFSKERRLNIAAMVMQGVMANPYWTKKRMSYALRQNENKEDAVNEFINDIIEDAVNLTDALIAEAGKGDKK